MTETTKTKRNQPNRLGQETSPYLLQHAENPVDWYPWGEEALKKAGEEDKPIFLSIGYSACHWCHVMEHESFENDEIAELMNRYFVNIKVDREERPDLDQIYMNSVLAITGRGGWPMSVFLTPDLKPFYGGTYWPAESRMGMPGFRDVLQKVHEAWDTRRDDVLKGADELTGAIVKMGVPQGGTTQLNEELLRNAMRTLLRSADRAHGGFSGAPKFPHAMDLRVLLRGARRFGSDEALDVVKLTLDKMARGGIYDHLGGGFHRYATDPKWLVPHFEKMLYDNALLTSAYLEAFQATGEADYARVVRETLNYVQREMTQPEGGFYSTQDADSEGVEGKYFVWSEEELVEVLGSEDARIFSDCYDVTPDGNWEGMNILNRIKTHRQAAEMLGMNDDELTEILDRCKRKLFEARQQRVPPGRDDKVLVSWNGLMISAMAQAAEVLGERDFAQTARNAADFILERMRTEQGGLLHSYKDGRSRFNAYLDDYACFIDGLVELYQATFEVRYLEAALELAERMVDQFHDPSPHTPLPEGEGPGVRGGFFFTPADHETLIVRHKDSQDTATPSGNAMAATALLRLGRLCGRADLEEKAAGTLEMLSGQLAQIPMAGGQALIALDFLLGPTYEVAVVDGERPEESRQVLETLSRRFLPNKLVARRPRDLDDDALPAPLQPLLTGKTTRDGAVTLYLCEHGTCQRPVAGVDEARSALDAL